MQQPVAFGRIEQRKYGGACSLKEYSTNFVGYDSDVPIWTNLQRQM